MSYTEENIKYEGKNFFVIWDVKKHRFEVLKRHVTHATVEGWGDNLEQVVRTAKRLERYPHMVQ